MKPTPLRTLALLALAAAAAQPAFGAAQNPPAPMGPTADDMAKMNAALKAQLEAADPAIKPIYDRHADFAPLIGPAATIPVVPVLTDKSPDGEFMVGPDYANAPEMTPVDGVPKGKIYEFTMDSADSKIYPGLRGPYMRQVTVYVPSQYVAGTPAPFMVCQDAYGAKNQQLPNILDNMIAAHRVPALVAIMIANGGGDGQGSERGLEYDTVSGLYAEFIESEVLPRIAKDYNITFTKDPEGRATYGGSSGGSAAFSMAWFHPELYHRVLTYSGTYVNQQSPANPASPNGAWEYHQHLIPESPVKPLRIWLEVGQNDNGATAAESGYHNWLLANEHMATVLKAKGYHYQLVYALGGQHTDGRVIAQTLPHALEWLWQGYPITPAK